MPRWLPLALVAALALGGCGADLERTVPVEESPASDVTAPPQVPRERRGGATTEAEPPPSGGGERLRAATYGQEVDRALDAFARQQRRAFAGLREATFAEDLVGALGVLRGATAGLAADLRALEVPGAARLGHERLIAAVRRVSDALREGIEARAAGDPRKLQNVGRRLASGAYSREIRRAARQIDRALVAAGAGRGATAG